MAAGQLTFKKSGLDIREWKKLEKLSTPELIQDFLNSLSFNFEKRGETYRSVSEALKAKEAHCFEGALIAAAALWIRGERPLLLDLSTSEEDDDHVVALFKRDGLWGAVSKTNHTVLRYRDPVYRSPRELAMSYFNEYYLENGAKTMRSFSKPFDLSKVKENWLSSKEDLTSLVIQLDRSPRERVLTTDQVKNLRKTDKIERQALKLKEW